MVTPPLIQVQLSFNISKETTFYYLCSRTNDPVSIALRASHTVLILISKPEPAACSRLSISRLSLLDSNAPSTHRKREGRISFPSLFSVFLFLFQQNVLFSSFKEG